MADTKMQAEGTHAWAIAERFKHGWMVLPDTIRRTRRAAISAYDGEPHTPVGSWFTYRKTAKAGRARAVRVTVHPAPEVPHG